MTTTALSSSMKQTAEPVISRRQPAPAIYALAQYSVEQRADRSWHYARTTDHFLGSTRPRSWRGPYRSLHAVTLAIAHALKQEAAERHRKRCEHDGVAP